MIDSQRSGSTTIIRLDNGAVNALDVELLRALAGCLDEVDRSDSTAVVITGNRRAFSAGVDLVKIIAGDTPFTAELLNALSETLRALFSFRLPVVSAVSGPAIAGGCIIACAGDRRLMGVGAGRIGVPELVVGVPFPSAAIEIVRYVCGNRSDEAVFSGALYTPDQAQAIGMIHDVVPDEELLDRALAAAEALAVIPSHSFELTKLQLRQPALDCMRDGSRTRDRRVAEIWSDSATRASIRAHLDRLAARKH